MIELTAIKYNFYIFEKDKPKYLEDIYKDGFHIMIPDIIVDFKIKQKLRCRVIELLTDQTIFNNHLGTLENIVDKAVIQSNGWFLYYSKKPKEEHAYKLTQIFNKKLKSRNKQISEDNDYIDFFQFIIILINIIKRIRRR